MIYYYKCNKCKHTKQIEQPMSEPLPKDIPCDNCKDGVMNQDYSKKLKTMKFNIPCTFNDEEYRPRNLGDDSAMDDYIGGLDG